MTRYILNLTVAVGALLAAGSAIAGVPDPGTSTVPPIMVGEETPYVLPPSNMWDDYKVIVRDINGTLVAGATVTIDFSTAAGNGGISALPNPGQQQQQKAGTTVNCPAKILSRVTDANGEAFFEGGFGGAENTATVKVSADGVLLLLIQVRSTDMNALGDTDSADLNLFRQNFFNSPGAQESDFSLNGTTGSEDLNIFRQAFFTATIPAPC